MNVPDEGTKLGKAPAKPEGAEWAEPLEVIDKVTYRADGGGYLKPGFDHLFVVDADGGAPRQLTFGAYHDGDPTGPPDGRAILFSADSQAATGSAMRYDSEVYRLDLVERRDARADQPQGARRAPVSFARRPADRLSSAIDDHGQGL